MTVLRNGRLVGEYLTAELEPGRAGRQDDRQGARRPGSGSTRSPRTWRGPASVVIEREGARPGGGASSRSRSPSTRARWSAWPGCSAPAAPSWPGCSSAPTTPTAGEVAIDGEPVSLRTPRAAIAQGIAFCSENRRTEGLVADLTVRENIILALQAARGWTRPIPRRRQDELVEKYINALRHPPRQPRAAGTQPQRRQPAEGAAGPLADHRAAAADPRRADPRHRRRRQGRDPAALVVALSDDGMAVLFISAELEEVLRLSHQVGVLRDRHLVGRS